MLNIHTAHLSTLVPATGAFLSAASLTGKHQLFFSLNYSTRNLLSLAATSAFNSGGERARATAVLVAKLITQMNCISVAAGQRLAADFAAGGNGVSAAPSLWIAKFQQLGQGRLPTGTAAYQLGRERAWLALAGVACLLATVDLALQHLSTWLVAGEMSNAIKAVPVSPTGHLPVHHSTVTHLLHTELAGLA